MPTEERLLQPKDATAIDSGWNGRDVSDIYVNISDISSLPQDVRLPRLIDAKFVVFVLTTCLWVTGLTISGIFCFSPHVFVGAAQATAARLAGGAVFAIGLLYITWSVSPCVRAAVSPPPGPSAVCPFTARPGPQPAPRSALMVVNPKGGHGKSETAAEKAKAKLSAAGITVTTFGTAYPGHARLVPRSPKPEAVVVLGGDGTLHEVVNGLNGERIPIGVVPTGSGNALAASLMQNLARHGKDESCSGDVDACVDWGCAQITRGHTYAIDQMDVCIGNRHITGVVICYFGLLGEVDIVAEPMRCLGSVRFDIAAILMLLKGVSCGRTRLSYVDEDGEDCVLEDDFVTAAVGNTQYWTDVMRGSPNSVLDDGLLEVILFKPCPRFIAMRIFLLIESGAHVRCPICRPYLEVLQVRRVRFEFLGTNGPTAGVFNVDGEIFRHPGTVDISCVERSLPVFASDAHQY